MSHFHAACAGCFARTSVIGHPRRDRFHESADVVAPGTAFADLRGGWPAAGAPAPRRSHHSSSKDSGFGVNVWPSAKHRLRRGHRCPMLRAVRLAPLSPRPRQWAGTAVGHGGDQTALDHGIGDRIGRPANASGSRVRTSSRGHGHTSKARASSPTSVVRRRVHK